MTTQLSNLPPEIVFMILSHIPVPYLLAFGATCRTNYIYHILCMRRLHLAIFHKSTHAMAAFLGAGFQQSLKEPIAYKQTVMIESYKVQIILPHEKPAFRSAERISHRISSSTRHKSRRLLRVCSSEDKGYVFSVSCEQTVRAQNKTFADIVRRYGQSLEDLEFLAYGLNEEGALALGTNCGPKLRSLALRFDHPYVRDISLSQKYWSTPGPGSPAWNSLIGIGPLKGRVHITNLESLVLERASITPWQLRMLVKRNKRLKVLKLKTCAGTQPEFVNWLGGVSTPEDDDDEPPRQDGDPVPGASIVVLWIENCDTIRTIKSTNYQANHGLDAGLEWVRNLHALESLSFRECRHIDSKVVVEANKLLWHIPELHLPQLNDPRVENLPVIEVDPIHG